MDTSDSSEIHLVERLPRMLHLVSIVASLSDVLQQDARCIRQWVGADCAVPARVVPRNPDRQMYSVHPTHG